MILATLPNTPKGPGFDVSKLLNALNPFSRFFGGLALSKLSQGYRVLIALLGMIFTVMLFLTGIDLISLLFTGSKFGISPSWPDYWFFLKIVFILALACGLKELLADTFKSFKK